jgi:hypothetical protein
LLEVAQASRGPGWHVCGWAGRACRAVGRLGWPSLAPHPPDGRIRRTREMSAHSGIARPPARRRPAGPRSWARGARAPSRRVMARVPWPPAAGAHRPKAQLHCVACTAPLCAASYGGRVQNLVICGQHTRKAPEVPPPPPPATHAGPRAPGQPRPSRPAPGPPACTLGRNGSARRRPARTRVRAPARPATAPISRARAPPAAARGCAGRKGLVLQRVCGRERPYSRCPAPRSPHPIPIPTPAVTATATPTSTHPTPSLLGPPPHPRHMPTLSPSHPHPSPPSPTPKLCLAATHSTVHGVTK